MRNEPFYYLGSEPMTYPSIIVFIISWNFTRASKCPIQSDKDRNILIVIALNIGLLIEHLLGILENV